VDIHHIPENVLLFNFVLYGCLPLWLVMGCLDYYCHRKSGIEKTSGLKESLYHAVMGIQIGIPVFLGLYFEINTLLFIVMFLVLVFHEWVAHHDVAYAMKTRKISMFETHVHSFLEVIPFVIVALIVLMNWSNFVDFVTFNWAGHCALQFKKHPLDLHYITGYVALMLIADVVPYMEEFWRCFRHRSHVAKAQSASEAG
jgi:uncharacterized protein YqgC (DUF456 family)